MDRWLSVDKVAEHLGGKRDAVYKGIERRKLPAHKVGRLWKFKVSEVDRLVRSGSRAKEFSSELLSEVDI